jgi:hypothetical protein
MKLLHILLTSAFVLAGLTQTIQPAAAAERAAATADAKVSSPTLVAPKESSVRHEFTTMVGHWAEYADPAYMPFIKDARPEMAQFGFYGAHYWSLGHTPQYKGYPAHLPVQGLPECAAWFAEKNKELHSLGVKVVGHMNVIFLVGDPDFEGQPRGFFKFYRDLWDEKVLGPKPTQDVLSLLEVDKDGKPIQSNSYSIGGMKEYWGCLRNPDWRAVLKAWVRFGIKQGVDGFIANYFYRHDCHCKHCVAGFKKHLEERYAADQLKEQFGIADLKSHKFDEIVSWHKPDESTPLRREMLAFSQITNKQAFDDVFINYGRSIKPDLMVAQWNHLSNFSSINGDERCLLPTSLWGKGEDYTWYSMGASGCYSDIAGRYLGEGSLQARYIRGSLDEKPYTLGKYEHTRIRVSIAELAANGGAPMGFYTRFKEPEAREVIVQYYNFIRDHADIFKASTAHGEVLLLFPRSRVHNSGDNEVVTRFKELGTQLLDEHVLFDIRPDDLPLPEGKTYAVVIDPSKHKVEDLSQLLPTKRTKLDAPWTVRLSANRSAKRTDAADEITLHLVNYNRTEPELKLRVKPDADAAAKEAALVAAKRSNTGKGCMDEKPIPAAPSTITFVAPAGSSVGKATAYSPEWTEPRVLETKQTEAGLEIKVPEYLVYCVIRLGAGK